MSSRTPHLATLAVVLLLGASCSSCASSGSFSSSSEAGAQSRGEAEVGWRPDVDLPAVATDVASGMFHSCARMTDGEVRCWGIGATKETQESRREFGQARPPERRLSQLAAGAFHTCGLIEDTDQATCWGRNDFGQSEPPLRQVRGAHRRRISHLRPASRRPRHLLGAGHRPGNRRGGRAPFKPLRILEDSPG